MNLLYRNFGKICKSKACIRLVSSVHSVLQKGFGKSNTIRSIQNLLDINYRNAVEIVNENTQLTERSQEFLNRNYSILSENNVDCHVVLKYPQLLCTAYLEEAINDLKTLPYKLDVTAVLACLVKPKLHKLINCYERKDNKIDTIAKVFQVPPGVACEYLYQKDFLISKDPQILNATLKAIIEFGIPLEEIKRDLWIFKYSLEVIKERISLLKELHIQLDAPKPWMLRSPMKTIENYARRRTDNRQILGNASLSQYLSKELDCSEIQANYLIVKMPALKTKSLKKLSSIINFLYSKNFKPFHIYRVPKILVHSVETTKKRLEKLEKSGVQVDSLYMLTKSQKQFSQYFEALMKGKKSSAKYDSHSL